MNIERVVKMVVAEAQHGSDPDRADLAENLDSAAFELEHAANQLKYSAGDVRKGIQLSPPMYEYVTKKSIAALRAVLTTFGGAQQVTKLQGRIDEYQDTFKSRHNVDSDLPGSAAPQTRDDE